MRIWARWRVGASLGLDRFVGVEEAGRWGDGEGARCRVYIRDDGLDEGDQDLGAVRGADGEEVLAMVEDVGNLTHGSAVRRADGQPDQGGVAEIVGVGQGRQRRRIDLEPGTA